MPGSGAPFFYLELNDDALIRDIVSGIYTGAPEARDIQNLWPFGAVVSALYRILPGVPWFGALLFGLQVFSILLILWRALVLAGQWAKESADRRTSRAGLIAGTGMIWLVVQLAALPHFVFVQYSVTVGFLAAAAAFLLVTGEKKRHFAAAVALTGIAYSIRSELLLLLLPILLVGLLFRYVREVRMSRAENEEMPGAADFVRYPFVTDHYRRYGVTLIAIFLVLAACWSLNRIGYAPDEWHEFVRFFDARTEVYDFTGVPPYEGNEEFYASAGLGREAAGLLENYNFGLEEAIDADRMQKVAAYAKKLLPPAGTRLKEALSGYLYRLRHAGYPADFTWPQTDAPWNLIAAVLYLALILLSWFRAPKGSRAGERLLRALGQPALLFACRSALWLYILFGARDPVRITHPLYFAELAVLAGSLLMQTVGARKEVEKEEAPEEARGADEKRNAALTAIRCCAALAVLLIGAAYAGRTFSLIREEQARRAEANAPYEALRAYCDSHKDGLYFLDVYSSVRETRPLFSEAAKRGNPANLELSGGWAAKSPLWSARLDSFDFDSEAEALLSENVYFVADAAADISWLEALYEEKGVAVAVEKAEEIAGADGFAVWDVRESAP